MGQTLTHGVYLPDEGERNCYSGLASNWSILDGAVGTIAEHTSALAGKAPLVHTHTKSDITDFPAYGTTAGTICEGNDSRLSDARTPVAHTHDKADVTDLLNSNFIPSANNSYDLGSSSYQWNNLYAKNYYYNGVAWGLDQNNTWSGQNTFSSHLYIYGQWKGLYFKNPEVTAGVAPSGDKRNYIAFLDSNGYILGNIILNVIDANSTWLQIGVFAKDVNDSSQSIYCGTQYRVYGNGEKYFNPSTNGDVHLGTSTLKWKSLNGINPGALSLPGTGGFTDIKGDITNLSGGDNTFTAPYDGWVCVKSTNATVIHIINLIWAVSQSATQSTAGTLCCLCPVMSGQSFRVIVNATSLDYAYIHPCKGNV